MKPVKRIEQGHAAHFCGAGACLFRRATYITNGYIISTVGEYEVNNKKTQIGFDRFFETYVFIADKKKSDCGCYIPIDYCEIDSVPANDPKTAQANHEKMIRKWSKK